jgi:hypothetical protein
VWPTVVAQGGLFIPRTIRSLDLLRELKLDDDEILDLDASICKTPAMVRAAFRLPQPAFRQRRRAVFAN